MAQEPQNFVGRIRQDWCRARRSPGRRRREASHSPAAGSPSGDDLDVRPRPYPFSASIISGIRVRCPAASDDAPTTSTFFSTAISRGFARVWNNGPAITSKPRSMKALTQIGPSVVPVLTHLGDHDSGLSAEPPSDAPRALRPPSSACRCAPAIDSADRLGTRCHSVRTPARARPKFLRACRGRAPPRGSIGADCPCLARLAPAPPEPREPSARPGRRAPSRSWRSAGCEPWHCRPRGFRSDPRFQPVAVDSDDHRLAGIDLGRARRGGFLDAVLGQPVGDRLGHSAMLFDFLDQRPCACSSSSRVSFST